MNQKLRLLCLGFCLLAFFKGNAASGDTTWVQAHNSIWLDYYNNFDTAVTFPDGTKSYRRIYMVFTLGKYVCPGSPTYCSDWDYTVQNFLMTPGGDTIELGRLITPYGKGPAMPASWSRDYVFDVTDYYPLLKNEGTVRLLYSGYSGGFTANIRFAFIEGERDRDVTGIHNLWQGSWAYGNAANPINDHLPAYSGTVPAGTASEALHINVTGHGADPNYCSEFCSKWYRIYHNGTMAVQHDIWRNNCGQNDLYPQSGTWIYDRANWCPGDKVHTLMHEFPVTAGSTDSLRMAFENYTSDGSASYTVNAILLYYSNWNKTRDASLEAIVAPSSDKTYFRQNTSCASSVIRIKNSGADPITSLTIAYGLEGGPMETFEWNGTMDPGTTQDISLPPFDALRNASGSNTFQASIVSVNGATGDDETDNNLLKSTFTAPATWKTDIIVSLKTNFSTVPGGYSETSWKILDAADNVVFERNNLAPNTLYKDTLHLEPNCYRLFVNDEGCDGLSWWANPGAGTGNLKITPVGSVVGYAMDHYFSGDFGCDFTQYFKTDYPTGVPVVSATQAGLEIYPNPAASELRIDLTGLDQPDGTAWVMDAVGRKMLQATITGSSTRLDVSQLAPGTYFLIYQDKAGQSPRINRSFSIVR